MPPKLDGRTTRFGRAFAETLVHCPNQVRGYGACLGEKFESVSKGACEKEFAALRSCFRQVVQKQRGRR
jgi:hypothetical protein